MKKALATLAVVLALCPLLAPAAGATEPTPAATAAPAAPANTVAALDAPDCQAAPAGAPQAPVFQPEPRQVASCESICSGEWSSCRLDCRFNPYPGCTNDCWVEYQACLAGC